MDQPRGRAAHDESLAEGSASQIPMQPVTCRPADDSACEQVDDDRQIQPTFAGPDVGNVGVPLLVRLRRCEVLVEQVRSDRPGMMVCPWSA
jgi:hypothetical protein